MWDSKQQHSKTLLNFLCMRDAYCLFLSVTSVTVPKSYIVQTCALTHTAHSTHLLYISHLPHCNTSPNFFHAIFSTIKAYTICIDPLFLITNSLLLSCLCTYSWAKQSVHDYKHKLQIEVHQLCCSFFLGLMLNKSTHGACVGD